MNSRAVSSSPDWTTRLSRLPDVFWMVFLIWSAVGVLVLPLGIGEDRLHAWIDNPGLRAAAVGLLRASDALWIFFGAVVVYFHTARAEGLPTARRWAGFILFGSACLEWIGATTGYPFGPYRYTDHFGWLLGGVLPVTIPLAWLIVVLCGRYATLALFPSAARWQVALGTALVAVLTDFNLESVAWKVRAYWIWYPGLPGPPPNWPPLQNYLSWFAFSFLFAWLLPPNHRLRLYPPKATRPVAVLLIMNGLFLLVHATRGLHGV